ncbi:hypothetical protein BGX27_009629 [Mortierella sp. AM989]|nr:hypothetical protein BGX27_009629 [Mortierella sp. AM989]
MLLSDDFSINDLSPRVLFLLASPSIFNCLMYELEEVAGMSPYQLLHPEDIEACKTSHQEVALNGIESERISRNHKAFYADTWNHGAVELEIHARLFLNRFTRNLCIMYASPSCQSLFDIDPDDLLGKSFLLFIRADALILGGLPRILRYLGSEDMRRI